MFTKRLMLYSARHVRYACVTRVRSNPCFSQNLINHRELAGYPCAMKLQCFSRSTIPSTRSYSEIKETSSPITERIEQLVKNNKVVIFMKGVPDQPMCGFSNAVVQVLRMHGVKDYDAHNVLENEELRQGIKDFSEWPTIPQIYFDGEFIGGCDILLQMHQSGDLIEDLNKLGIKSDLIK